MTSEQLAELIWCQVGGVQDAAQRGFENVPARMDSNGHGAAVRVLHEVMAAGDPRQAEPSTFQSLDYLCSTYGRDSTRHNAGSYQKSGDVESQGQLVGYACHFDQALKRDAQIRDTLCLRLALAERGDARTKLGGRGPEAGLVVLLQVVGHVNDSCHKSSMPCGPSRSHTVPQRLMRPLDVGRVGTSRVTIDTTERVALRKRGGR